MAQSWGWWLGFNLFVLAMLALDLGLIQRKSRVIKLREALVWSVIWILTALVFDLGLWRGWFGSYPAAERGRVALEFLTGYLIEKALSVDNLFVFAVIFTYFAVPAIYHHRVLFYGIVGALLCRAVFIFGGLWLIEQFAWTTYLFGAFLIFTGIKLGVSKEKEIEPQRNPILRLLRAVLPVSQQYVGGRFLTREGGRSVATPLLLVLVFLEVTDVIFALDSIPAIIAITQDSYIVYTSNIFAILGLRALYFVLAAFMRTFHYLAHGLAVILVFVGGKMLAEAAWHVKLPVAASLGAVVVVLGIAVLASILFPPRTEPPQQTETP